MYVTATLERKARALDFVEEIVVERDGTTVVKHITISLSPKATLVVVVEIVVAESEPLHIVLTIEQTVIAILVGCTTIEELAVIYPNVTTPIGLSTCLVGLDANAIRVTDLHLRSIAKSNYLIFTRLEHWHSLHRKAAVADDDVIHRLHHKGDVGEERSFACGRVNDSDESLVGSYQDALAVGGFDTAGSALVIQQLTRIDTIDIALDTS